MKKKTGIALLALVPALLAGCGSKEDKTITIIKIEHYDGGVGHVWLNNAISRFTALKAEESYESGKKGVKIEVQNTKQVNVDRMSTGTKHIYITEDNGFPQVLAAKGTALDITDWITGEDGHAPGESVTIESKIDEEFRNVLRYGNEQRYYGLPHYEIYPGVTYDYELFEKEGLYFALDTEEEDIYTFDSDITKRSYSFVDAPTTERSLGSDGLPNTADDGLPSSIEEFIVLCEYMDTLGIVPMLFPGNHQDYSSYFMEGLLASLSGKEGIMSYYNLDGEINYIESFQNDGNYLFPGSGLNTPNVVKTTISDETGYKIRLTEERYACACLMELMHKKNYFNETFSTDKGNTNETTQTALLEGKRHSTFDVGMICEGNYWINEAKDGTVFKDFYRNNPSIQYRDVRWMPLPSHISTSITTANAATEGKASTLMDTGNSFYIVNKKVSEKEGLMRAVKEFTQFLFSDAELQAFTKTTGLCISGINYDFHTDEIYNSLEPFQKAVLSIKEAAGCAWMSSHSKVFKAKRGDLYFSINAPVWQPKEGSTTYASFIQGMRQKGYNAQKCIEYTTFDPETWRTNFYEPNK